jgi:UDP-GlcNAc:undecaprenyl-phosphate GlcNAc-1-phosphate transferase
LSRGARGEGEILFTDFAVAAAVSALVSLIACRGLIFAGLYDLPTLARKTHKAPTPTAGGIGIGVGAGVGVLMLTMLLTEWRAELSASDLTRLAYAVGASYVFLLIGFVDDAYALGPRLKLAIFGVASYVAVNGVGPALFLPLGGDQVVALGPWLGVIGSMLWVFTLVNCVNFMDGSNGLSMGSTAIGLFSLAAVSIGAGAPAAAALSLAGAGALLGFLVWNFPKGALFAGDSGALFSGAVAALASLLAIKEGAISPFIPPILFFPLLADALLTLAWRASKRRNLLDGHAEHIYQIGLRAKVKHTHVAIAYWAAAVHCGVLGFVASHVWSGAMDLRAAGDRSADLATYLPLFAFLALAGFALMVSRATRKYAAARGMDQV